MNRRVKQGLFTFAVAFVLLLLFSYWMIDSSHGSEVRLVLCDGIRYDLGDVVPEDMVVWPFSSEYGDPWLGEGLFPSPRPPDWVATPSRYEPCLLMIGSGVIPIIVLFW